MDFVDGALFALYSLTFWVTISLLVELFFDQHKLPLQAFNDNKNRYVSILHGITTFLWSVFMLFGQGCLPGGCVDQWGLKLIIFSLTYAVTDFTACYFYGLIDKGLILHHSMMILGYLSILYYQSSATEAIQGIFVAEVSNAPMHIRMILKNYGLRYTKAYQFCQILYISSYIVFRGLIFPIFYVPASLQSSEVINLVKLSMVTLFLQSMNYIVQMWSIMRRKLKHRRQQRTKGIQYNWLSINPRLCELSYFNAKQRSTIF